MSFDKTVDLTAVFFQVYDCEHRSEHRSEHVTRQQSPSDILFFVCILLFIPPSKYTTHRLGITVRRASFHTAVPIPQRWVRGKHLKHPFETAVYRRAGTDAIGRNLPCRYCFAHVLELTLDTFSSSKRKGRLGFCV